MESQSFKNLYRDEDIEFFHDVTIAIQMIDDFINKRDYVIGYDVNDIDNLDISHYDKQKIKSHLSASSAVRYAGNDIYQTFLS